MHVTRLAAITIAFAAEGLLAAGFDFPLRDVPRIVAMTGSDVVVAADFDLDGRLDLFIEGAGSSILFGSGDGTVESPSITFDSRTEFGYADGQPSALVADFDGDALPDVITVNANSQTSLHRNRGRRRFDEPVVIFDKRLMWPAAAADFTADGHVDLLLTYVNREAILLINDGGGRFSQRADTGIRAHRVAAADLDRDGDIDLAGTDTNNLATFTNDGTGRFRRSVLGPASYPVLADLDRDERPEIIAVPFGKDAIEIYNGSRPSQRTPLALPADLKVRSAFAADFNRDGVIDLAISSSRELGPFWNSLAQTETVAIYLGDGRGNLVRHSEMMGLSVAAADFNLDSALDLVVRSTFTVGNASAIILGNGDGTFRHPPFISGFDKAFLTATADFDGNGIDEIVLTSTEGTYIGWLAASGQYEYDLPAGTRSAWQRSPLAVGNVRGGPEDEVVITHPAEGDSRGGRIRVASAAKPGEWTVTAFDIHADTERLLIADVNGDGTGEIIILAKDSNETYTLRVFSADGSSLFSSVLTSERDDPLHPTHFDLHALDADRDGAMEVVVMVGGFRTGFTHDYDSYPLSFVALYRGRPGGSLTGPEWIVRDSTTSLSRVYDVDGDGNPDVLVEASILTSYIWDVFLSDGHGGFIASDREELRRFRIPHMIADFDLDGFEDLRFGSCISYGSSEGLRERICYLPAALGCGPSPCMWVRRGDRTPALMTTVNTRGDMISIAPTPRRNPPKRDWHPVR